MTVSLSSGPLMSECLIALMIASVCVCCEWAGARLRPQLSAKWKALILVRLVQAWSQAGGAAAACHGITCPGPNAHQWYPKQCLGAAAWKTFRRGKWKSCNAPWGHGSTHPASCCNTQWSFLSGLISSWRWWTVEYLRRNCLQQAGLTITWISRTGFCIISSPPKR